jgi:hypothetical protein
MTTTSSSIRSTALSRAYSKYASSTTSGLAAGIGPSSPVGLLGRQQIVSTGSSSPTSAPATRTAMSNSAYVGSLAIATRSPGPANERVSSMTRSSAPAPSTMFSGATPAYSAIASRSRG